MVLIDRYVCVQDKSDDEDDDEELFNFRHQMSRKSAKNRPPSAPFDADRLKEMGADITTDGDFIMCEGQRYRRHLLYKVFPLTSVTNEGINPSIEELKHFQDKPTTDPDFLREREFTNLGREPSKHFSFARQDPRQPVHVRGGRLGGGVRGRADQPARQGAERGQGPGGDDAAARGAEGGR